MCVCFALIHVCRWDTWSELGGQDTCVQPTRLGPEEVRDPACQPSYWLQVRPLLFDMNQTFTGVLACRHTVHRLTPHHHTQSSHSALCSSVRRSPMTTM